jgi:hypothetical protein
MEGMVVFQLTRAHASTNVIARPSSNDAYVQANPEFVTSTKSDFLPSYFVDGAGLAC